MDENAKDMFILGSDGVLEISADLAMEIAGLLKKPSLMGNKLDRAQDLASQIEEEYAEEEEICPKCNRPL